MSGWWCSWMNCSNYSSNSFPRAGADSIAEMSADCFDFDAPGFTREAQAGLLFLPQRAETGPEVAAHEDQQERQREEVHHVDAVVDDGQKTNAHGDLGEGQPAALSAVGHFERHAR